MTTVEENTSQRTSSDLVRFHISLNVDDLARSVEFYRLLFDVPTAKQQPDYAKFELDNPPLILSLAPIQAPRAGKLNHLGFRLASSEALVALQQRLEAHGTPTTREEGVECCYSRQTKFWVTDPDGNLWELYTLDDDHDDEHGAQCRPAPPQLVAAIGPAPALWAHRLGEPFPAQVLAATDGVDEVLLQGTFNAALDCSQRRQILAEVRRVLKPGGKLTLHQLSSRTPLTRLSQPLPGPAAPVEAVPSAEELADDLQAAGFVDLYFEKLGGGHCLIADGVECRETRLIGFKANASAESATRHVLYRGPLAEVADDRGNRFRRGHWTPVDAETWQRLQAEPYRDQFVL